MALNTDDKPKMDINIHEPTASIAHILIVDDDARIRALLCRYLQENGWRTSSAGTAHAARHLMDSLAFDALIVDVMMPDETGFSFVKSLRAADVRVPVLMLTAKAEVEDRIMGLELGADDYLTKPFAPRELELRLQRLIAKPAMIEAPAAQELRAIHFGSYRFDLTTKALSSAGNAVYITERERQILEILANTPNQIVPRRVFLAQIQLDTRALDVAMKRLRDKLEHNPAKPHYILTARGVGFQLAGHGI